HRRDLIYKVVREEWSPGLRSSRRATAQIARDGPFRDSHAELQQLAVDPRSAPETVLSRNTLNQNATGCIDAWSSRTVANADADIEGRLRAANGRPCPAESVPTRPATAARASSSTATTGGHPGENADSTDSEHRVGAGEQASRAGDLDAWPE